MAVTLRHTNDEQVDNLLSSILEAARRIVEQDKGQPPEAVAVLVADLKTADSTVWTLVERIEEGTI